MKDRVKIKNKRYKDFYSGSVEYIHPLASKITLKSLISINVRLISLHKSQLILS